MNRLLYVILKKNTLSKIWFWRIFSLLKNPLHPKLRIPRCLKSTWKKHWNIPNTQQFTIKKFVGFNFLNKVVKVSKPSNKISFLSIRAMVVGNGGWELKSTCYRVLSEKSPDFYPQEFGIFKKLLQWIK